VKQRVLARYFFILFGLLLSIEPATQMLAQAAKGTVRGQVTDPSGAVIPNANVSLTTPDGHTVATVTSNANGSYQVNNLTPGTYIVIANAEGFASSNSKAVSVTAGQTKQFDVALEIQVEKQQVQVNAEGTTVDTSPDSNANAVVIKGKDLDALSDDPDELSNELQALAGPSAGPNGGQIYIDGFTGGQIPPKSSIREIRVNQNPFSAQYDRLGYGRIEILTKPGTDKLHGSVGARGNDSSFNAANPILNSNLQPGQPTIPFPDYYTYFLNGNVGGSLSKRASFFVNAFGRNIQNVSVVDAINPATTDPTNPVYLNQTVSNPSTRIDISPRFDFQLGEGDTLTVRYSYTRNTQTNSGIGQTSLPSTGYNTHNLENEIQLSNSWVMSPHVVNDMRFEYTRGRVTQTPLSTDPTVLVQGAFTSGGSNSGTLRDNQDYYELQDYFTAAEGNHSLSFGARLRATRDANYTNAGANGQFTYSTLTDYIPNNHNNWQKYQHTIINQFTARATLFDAALFYQDDWKLSQRFTFSYGLRYETQNRINDKNDWAPRVSFAYALDGGGKKPAKTVLRAGYGWFFQRFGVANTFGGGGSTPFVIETIHHNVPVNGGQSNQQISINGAPIYYQIDPHFHAAVDMQGAIGVDRQIAKTVTANVTYLYSQGVHQYFTNNLSALPFDSSSGTYADATGLTPPSENLYTYQSGGFYRQHQIIASGNARYRRFSLFGFYVYNNAKSDTGGVNSFPSDAHNPGLDYGRNTFDIHNRFVLLGNIQAPWAMSFAPFLVYNSGTPYNITIGQDLTQNNQFNARPTFAASCSETGVVSTQFGCLNTNPIGTNEKIIPYGLGTGPQNVSLNLRVSKVIGIGPRVENGRGASGGGPGGGGGRGGRGFNGLSGNQGGPGRLDATVPRKYSLTLSAFSSNVLNHQNLGTPNGTLLSPFFDKSQSLAGGFFGPPTAGNRSIFLSADFNF
jgi:hypothetical protein